MSTRMKQTSVLLYEKQVDFLTKLCKMIEEQGQKKMSRSKIMRVLTKTLTCIKKLDVGKCRSQEEIERKLLKCFKKAVRELKK